MPKRSASRSESGRLLRRRSILAVAVVTFAASPLAAATAVVPPAQAAAEGNANTTMPFSCAGSSFTSERYQQVYRGSEVTAGGPITEIRFRRDGFVAPGFAATTIPGVTIKLSSTSQAPDGLSPAFASNVGGDLVTVFAGDLTLSSPASGAGTPKPFNIRVPLSAAFPFDPSSGLNLLLDVTIPTCKVTNAFDAVDSPTDGISIVRAFPSTSVTGTVTSTVGLVTQFASEPADATPLLQSGRFAVQVVWTDFSNVSGPGHAVPLTSEAGYFWFFGATNIELLVKVLNACVPPYDRYWVFVAGLTNVGVVITVTDTQTGAVRTYTNPRGRSFATVLDTGAFATCP